MPSRHDAPSPSGGSLRTPLTAPRLEGRVLVVDDTASKRYLVAQTLRMSGMEVMEAQSGQEALSAAALLPDVVVLDVRLPDMSGVEVCRELKANPATAAIPVLYLSTLLEDEELEARFFEDGADGYIPQPIEPRQLVAQAWALVRMRRAQRQREREREAAEAEKEALRRELESSETRLRLALDAAELGAWSHDFASGEWHLDGRAKAMLGLPEEASVDSEMWLASVHAEDRARVADIVERARASGQDGVFTTEYRALGVQDGVLRWVAVRGRMSFGVDGRVRRASGIWLDITERKLAEQRSTELLATTAAFAHALTSREVADALVEHGLQSLEAYAGAVCLAEGDHIRILSQFGYPMPVIDEYRLSPLSLRGPYTEAVRTGQTIWLKEGEQLAREWPEFNSTRDARSRSWLCVPLSDGGRVEGVLGLSFTTVRRFSPQERAHLESLCSLCTQALMRARLYEDERRQKEEARRRMELERQFLGMVSHDLRNPLQAISLGARTLQRLEQPTPELLSRVAERIASSAGTMGRMVADLLDFTRGRLGGGIPLEKASVDLMRVCREVLGEFALTHPEQRVVLEGDAVCEGCWDGPRMRQVLSNLVSNALRHAREGTEVKVRLGCEGGEAALDVENAGEPIPPELLPVLFEPFRRGSSKFKPSGSLGLGLYIVRQVVEGHGGQVRVASGPEGTCFTVRVPRGV